MFGDFGNAMDLYFGGDMNAAIALSGQVQAGSTLSPVAEVIGDCVEEFYATLADLADRYLEGRS
ncbi:MAG: hypothetical protein R2710_23415 [Acidimicrobiales bacterium]